MCLDLGLMDYYLMQQKEALTKQSAEKLSWRLHYALIPLVFQFSDDCQCNIIYCIANLLTRSKMNCTKQLYGTTARMQRAVIATYREEIRLILRQSYKDFRGRAFRFHCCGLFVKLGALAHTVLRCCLQSIVWYQFVPIENRAVRNGLTTCSTYFILNNSLFPLLSTSQ